MYRNTTPFQVARAVGVWLFGFGLLLLPTLVIQLLDLTWPGVAVTAAVLLFGGGAVYFGSGWAVRRADAVNRPLLFSPEGHTVLRGRDDFEKAVVRVRGWVLAAFLVTGSVFLVTISQHSCGTRTDGVCGYPRLSIEAMHGLQLTALVLGSLYVALVVLRGVHARESDRLSALISEGRKQRRAADPFAGTRRDGWDFD